MGKRRCKGRKTCWGEISCSLGVDFPTVPLPWGGGCSCNTRIRRYIDRLKIECWLTGQTGQAESYSVLCSVGLEAIPLREAFCLSRCISLLGWFAVGFGFGLCRVWHHACPSIRYGTVRYGMVWSALELGCGCGCGCASDEACGGREREESGRLSVPVLGWPAAREQCEHRSCTACSEAFPFLHTALRTSLTTAGENEPTSSQWSPRFWLAWAAGPIPNPIPMIPFPFPRNALAHCIRQLMASG